MVLQKDIEKYIDGQDDKRLKKLGRIFEEGTPGESYTWK